MPRTLLAAVVCIAGLLAGCGSGSKTVSGSKSNAKSTSTSSPVASLATAPVTLGPPPSGTRYNAVNQAFLQRLATILGHEFESRGFHNVNVTCTASVADHARCTASGTTDQGHSNSGTLKVTIDRTTGEVSLAAG